NDWERSLPQDAPNYFFINIPPDRRAEFMDFLAEAGGRTTRVLPMMRGRITHIGGQPVGSIDFADPEAREESEEEQNLTWAAELGPDNRVISGRWWTEEDFGKPLVSLASEYQELF